MSDLCCHHERRILSHDSKFGRVVSLHVLSQIANNWNLGNEMGWIIRIESVQVYISRTYLMGISRFGLRSKSHNAFHRRLFSCAICRGHHSYEGWWVDDDLYSHSEIYFHLPSTFVDCSFYSITLFNYLVLSIWRLSCWYITTQSTGCLFISCVHATTIHSTRATLFIRFRIILYYFLEDDIFM